MTTHPALVSNLHFRRGPIPQVAVTTKDLLKTTALFGRDTAALIDEQIYNQQPDDWKELFAYAQRIRYCNQNRNQWLGKNLTSDAADSKTLSGRLWSCGHKLCPSCVARQCYRNRRRARQLLSDDKLYSGQSYKFITLTSVNPGLNLLLTREVIYYAWTLLRKTKFWKDTIVGSIKDEEFTLTKAGFHYHFHIIAKSKYISYDLLRANWTVCLQNAWAEFDLELHIKTADQMAFANVRPISSFKSAINELCKYITTQDTWTDLDGVSLLDACRVRRFPRMFEVGGCFRRVVGSEADVERIRLEKKTILDTTVISDGATSDHWRDRINIGDPIDYLVRLQLQILHTQDFRRIQLRRRYMNATFRQLKCTDPNALEIAVGRFAALEMRALLKDCTQEEMDNARTRALKKLRAHLWAVSTDGTSGQANLDSVPHSRRCAVCSVSVQRPSGRRTTDTSGRDANVDEDFRGSDQKEDRCYVCGKLENLDS